MKKTLSLFVALILVLSVFALPASALENAEYCPNCGESATIDEYVRVKELYSFTVSSCAKDPFSHPHFWNRYADRVHCHGDCGTFYYNYRENEACILD